MLATLRRIIVLQITSAVPAVRASGRPAADHPVPDFVAADQASDLVGRPGSAGRLGLGYSCDFLRLVIEAYRQCPVADDAMSVRLQLAE